MSAMRAVESMVQGGLEATMDEAEDGVRLEGAAVAGGARAVAMIVSGGMRCCRGSGRERMAGLKRERFAWTREKWGRCGE